VLEKIIKKEEVVKEQPLEIPTVAQLLDEVDNAPQATPKSPYDTEQTMTDYDESSGIQEDSDSDLQSLPYDDFRSVSDHRDHICIEVNFLHSRLGNISNEIKSSLPAMNTNSLKEKLPRILSATLKDFLPLIVRESLQTHNPAVSE
ncbi:hypothetical protein Tco_1380669, partial [Tanacetum coccineum]